MCFLIVLYTALPIETVKNCIKYFVSQDNGLIKFVIDYIVESKVYRSKRGGGVFEYCCTI